MKKTPILVLLVIMVIPQMVSAAWWNPFTWSWVERLFSSKTEIHQIENTVSVAPVNKEASSTVGTEEKFSPITQTTKKETSITSTTNKKSTTPIVQTASATISLSGNTELELLRQQNEILKKQMEAQQQIAQNTTLVNGSCSTTLNICATGTFNDIADISTHYLWSCNGINDGSTASCSLPKPTSLPPTPTPTPSPSPVSNSTPTPYYPLTVSGFSTTTTCNPFATINLTSTSSSSFLLQENNPISITVSSNKIVSEVQMDSWEGQAIFEINSNGPKTVTNRYMGTGGVLMNTRPIRIVVMWSSRELPMIADVTVNSIKFADGTQVGGLPITIKGIGAYGSECVFN